MPGWNTHSPPLSLSLVSTFLSRNLTDLGPTPTPTRYLNDSFLTCLAPLQVADIVLLFVPSEGQIFYYCVVLSPLQTGA